MADGGLKGEAERRAAWSRLWAQGGAGSFHDPAGGDLPLRAHWQTWFATLPAHAHVLDIATGNGILPRWLIAAHPSATCDAIDLATIQPGWQHERVRFHAGVAAEQLPWRQLRFDAIVSQFGAEYGDFPKVCQQLTQVAQPGAQLHLVMHHANSRPAQLAAEEIDHANWLRTSGWVDAAHAMLEPMSLLDQPGGRQRLANEPRFLAVRARFDSLQEQRAKRAADSPCPDLLAEAAAGVARAFGLAAHEGHAAGEQWMMQLTGHLADSATRLLDMRAHTLDDSAISAAYASLESLGWQDVEYALLQDRGHLMGWHLQARR